MGLPPTHSLGLLCCAVQGGYNHYMEKEIFEQAETVAQTMQVRQRCWGQLAAAPPPCIGNKVLNAECSQQALGMLA